jgi:hypothetical protein
MPWLCGRKAISILRFFYLSQAELPALPTKRFTMRRITLLDALLKAALAGHLLKGKSIEDAAAALFISPHTARTHLKHLHEDRNASADGTCGAYIFVHPVSPLRPIETTAQIISR